MPVEYYEEDYEDGPSEPAKQGILEDPDSDTVRSCSSRDNSNTVLAHHSLTPSFIHWRFPCIVILASHHGVYR